MTGSLPAQLEPFPDGRADAGVAAARERLRAAGVEPWSWSNGPGDAYAAHDHATTKLLLCAEGSITFFVGDADVAVEIHAGHGFVLPARTRHSALVGPDGCTCLEGHRP